MRRLAFFALFCLCAAGIRAQAPKEEKVSIFGPDPKAPLKEVHLTMSTLRAAMGCYSADNNGVFLGSETMSSEEPNIGFDTSDQIFHHLVTKRYLNSDNDYMLTKSPGGPCTVSYIPCADIGDYSKRPFLCYPLVHGKTTFDPVPLHGKAMVIFGDITLSKVFQIESDGRVLVNGKDLFDPSQPYWKGKPPPTPK